MNFSPGGFFYTLLTFIVTAAALVLLLLSNVGSITNKKGDTSIYLLELNLANLNLDKVFPTDVSIDASTLLNNDVYILGMYGYCRGKTSTAGSDTDQELYATNFTMNSCTKAKPMYTFDPVNFLTTEFTQDTGVNLTASDISLPSKIEGYVKTADDVSKVIYITSCIAIVLNFLVAVLTIFMYCCRPGAVAILGMIEFVAFLAALIASGASTGMYKYIETAFNDEAAQYGIYASLSRNYLILTWIGTALCGVAYIMLFANCCCRCCCGGSPRKVYVEKEEY
ncbi:DEKNAAC101414 [Brettanomyces naardenensis]|uniref:DEKNAAC101414 n=1 Tax=Brettanomyces naardenensis TaxID=13370 RepID=A0A448YI31_BRENA|nr:DEKNAAC101414 [Brettanomyces naardenensis]